MSRLLLLLLLLLLAPAAWAAEPRELTPDQAHLELVFDEAPDPYEGEMVLATIRGTYRIQIHLEDLVLRHMADFDWVRLGQDTWREERIDGRMARVMERRVAFFPRRPGRLEILPIAHKLTYWGGAGERFSTVVRSEAAALEVRPRPVAEDEAWLPARAIEISDTWDVEPTELDENAIAQRRVVMRALGTTPEMMPTQPRLNEPWLISFSPPERRSMQLTPEGPVTTLTWVWSLKPVTGEVGVLPEIRFPWFDTVARAEASIAIPARAIGYADFADNRAGAWPSAFAAPWAVPAILIGAAALVVAGTVRGRRLSGLRATLRRRLEAYLAGRRILAAARRGDGAGLRRAALELAGRRGRREAALALLEPLDRHLFGPSDAGPPPDLVPLAARLRRLAR